MNLELFPCSGGASEGFRRAGIAFDLAIDADPDACESHERNVGLRPVQMDVRDFIRLLGGGWRPISRVEFLFADPPCTPWSRAGKRKGLDDDRDMLRETVRILDYLSPRCWMIANVPGLDDSDHWVKVVQPVIGGFAAKAGYCVDYAKLDAANYGVPQRRVRPFWFGHPVGTPCIRWPAPTHGDPARIYPSMFPEEQIRPWVTCREALGHLPLEHLGRPVRVRHRGSMSKDVKRCGTKPRASNPDSPAGTVTKQSEFQTALEWPWGRPSTTVTCRAGLAPPGHHPETGSIMSMPNAIVLSETAAAILQGFPESWHFSGDTKKARWAQIGMAMPPPFMEAVAREVARWIER